MLENDRSIRYSPERAAALLQSFLGGGRGWSEFAEGVMALWQEIAREEFEEQQRRPWLGPDALQKMGLDASADPDPLTPRQRSVRDIVGRLDEDVRWYLGDAEEAREGTTSLCKENCRGLRRMR